MHIAFRLPKIRRFNRRNASNDKKIDAIVKRAKNLRLDDCDETMLENFQQALLNEQEEIRQALETQDALLTEAMQKGRPDDIQVISDEIEHLSAEWNDLTKQLKKVVETKRELKLHNRIAETLGSHLLATLLERGVLALIIIVVGLTIIDLSVTIPEPAKTWIRFTDLTISLFLIVEFFFRFWLAEEKGWFFRRYWIDLLASIPFQEAFRFGRLARLTRFTRLARLTRLIRLTRVLLLVIRGLNHLTSSFQTELMKRSLIFVAILLLFGAFSISILEGENEAWIQNFEEGLWWSFATVVTGGWGDIYNPVTPMGRILTAGLVLLGLVVTGIFFATLTSVLVGDDSSHMERNQRKAALQLDEIQQKLGTLTETLTHHLTANIHPMPIEQNREQSREQNSHHAHNPLAHPSNNGVAPTNKRQTDDGINTDLQKLAAATQALASHHASVSEIAATVTKIFVDDFGAIQASMVRLHSQNQQLTLLHTTTVVHSISHNPHSAGQNHMTSQQERLIHYVVTQLASQPALPNGDIMPTIEPDIHNGHINLVYPLVARGQVMGGLLLVVPKEQALHYQYTQLPVILVSQTALAMTQWDL